MRTIHIAPPGAGLGAQTKLLRGCLGNEKTVTHISTSDLFAGEQRPEMQNGGQLPDDEVLERLFEKMDEEGFFGYSPGKLFIIEKPRTGNQLDMIIQCLQEHDMIDRVTFLLWGMKVTTTRERLWRRYIENLARNELRPDEDYDMEVTRRIIDRRASNWLRHRQGPQGLVARFDYHEKASGLRCARIRAEESKESVHAQLIGEIGLSPGKRSKVVPLVA